MVRLILLLILSWAACAAAAEFEASAGLACGNTLRCHDADLNSAAVEATALLDDRHWDISVGHIGGQDGGWEAGGFYYLSAQRIMRFGEILPVDLYAGLGLIARTWAPNVDELLPSPVSFSLSAGLDAGPLRIEFRHASNAGLKSPNRGENWLLIGWTF